MWQDMEEAGLTVRVEKHAHQVSHCQRCNTVVEPLLSVQWWVRTPALAKPAIEAVRSAASNRAPAFREGLLHWMENIRDWCISRQLWWGHRIPIWYGPDDHSLRRAQRAMLREQAIAHYGEAVHLEQDPDVLDTWFFRRTLAVQHPGLAPEPRTSIDITRPPSSRQATTSSSSGVAHAHDRDGLSAGRGPFRYRLPTWACARRTRPQNE